MKNQFLRMATAVLCLLLGHFNGFAANSYGIPTNIQDGNILHCFNWTAAQVKAELPAIAEAGFGAVQISPVQGNASPGAEWYFAYLPYDFAVRGNVASKSELTSLCNEADKYGIKIVVDVVANHVNKASGYHDPWWDNAGRVRWNGFINYGDRHSITHGQLGDYGDVNSEDAQVQNRAKKFVEELKSCGVDGIRWDAAKHIGLPSEGCNFWSVVASVPGIWHYGEILDGPGGDKFRLLKEYTNYIGVTDSEYSSWTRNEVNNGNVPSGLGSWSPNGVPSNKIVVFGETHDTYSNDGGESKYTPQDKIDRAWAILSCRAGESSLYFSRPPATDKNAIKIGQKGSTHFKSKEIAAINHFRNAAVGTRDYYKGENGVACITREGVGAAIIIGAGGSRQVTLSNGGGFCPAGTYIDEVSGNTFTVTASTISGNVGNTGIAVIYNSTITKRPSVTLDPNGGKFTSETLTVSATLNNASYGWYKIGNGAQQSFTGSTTFEIGAEMAPGESVTVSWSATGEEGTETGNATYYKADPDAAVYVYYNNPGNWNDVNCYIYIPGTPVKENGAWPGNMMAKDSSTGLWYYEVPAEFATGSKVIFNGGASQYPTGEGLDLNGTSMVCYDNTRWEEYGTQQGGGGSGGTEPEQPDVAPAQLFLMGNLSQGSWITNVGVEMKKEGNKFIASNVELVAAQGESSAFFSFVSVIGSTGDKSEWDNIINQADRYGALSKDAPIALGDELPMKLFAAGVNASSANAWEIAPGKYDIVADYAKMTIKIMETGQAGISEIESDDDNIVPIYYNLQGVRIQAPQDGQFYIVVKGSKVSKQFYRNR